MKNNITELVLILDRSVSMTGLESDTIGGFNSMIEKQKKLDEKCYVSTVLFDNESEVLHDRIDLADVPKMTDKEYFPVDVLLFLTLSAERYTTSGISTNMHGRRMFLSTLFSASQPTAWKMPAGNMI